jgi:type VI secretion system protein ImpA
MAGLSFNELAQPISEEAPCGPDLDLEGDADFLRFTARAEGMLPRSFFSFDRGSIDFPVEEARLTELLGRTRDLRLLLLAAKFGILNRDIDRYCAAIGAVRDLIRDRWAEVHPQPMDGDAMLRLVTVQQIDDLPDSVFPLQSAPLFQTRRFGQVNFRAQLLADGKIAPQVSGSDGDAAERVPSANDLRIALSEADIEVLVQRRDQMLGLLDTLSDIEKVFDRAVGEGQLRFKAIKPLAIDIAAYLDAAVVQRDPARGRAGVAAGADGDPEAGGASTAPVGTLHSRVDALNALHGAANYYARSEPSSPVRLFLAQAFALADKSFVEALGVLVPELLTQATVRLANDLPITMPLERFAEQMANYVPAEGAEPSVQEPPAEATSGDSWSDGWSSGDSSSEETPPADGETAESEPAGEPAAEPSDADMSAPPSAPRALPAGVPVVGNRADALKYLEQAGIYFRSAEPASAIPLLLDQARSLAQRDFVALLKEMLPKAVQQLDE